jgi:tetratricopeptide (TPR) repeat protein
MVFREIFLKNSRWISYWLNGFYYSVASFDPFIYRCGNLFFHCITGALVFFVTHALFTRMRTKNFFSEHAYILAFFTSALFLLHPLQTQTVSYVIQGQLEGLSGLFIMSMVLSFLIATGPYTTYIQYSAWLSLALCTFLACGTKEISIIAPLLLIIIDWFFVAQGDLKSFKRRLPIHCLITCCVIGIYIYFLKPQFFLNILGFRTEVANNIGNVLTHNSQDTITPYNFCISQAKVILHYIALFFWPFTMSVDYDWMLCRNIFALDCWLPFTLLFCSLIYIASRLYRDTTDVISFCYIWFFIALLPRASIIPSTELIADYKTYTASFGIFIILAAIVVAVCKRSKFKNYIYIFLILILGYLTYQRNTVWSSEEAFWLDIIKHAPKKARAYNNYGVALSHQNKHEAALSYFEKALDLDYRYPDALNNKAFAHSSLGQLDSAIHAIKQCIMLQPYYPEAYNNLASFLMQKHNYNDALDALDKAIYLRPHYGKAYFNKTRIYLMLDRVEDAWLSAKSACLEADFDNELGFNAFGMTSLMLNKFDDAIFAYSKTLAINPHSFEAQFHLANAYYLKHDYQQALPIFKTLLSHKPHDIKILYNYAETLLALDNYQAALGLYRRLQKIAPTLPGLDLRIAQCLAKTLQ